MTFGQSDNYASDASEMRQRLDTVERERAEQLAAAHAALAAAQDKSYWLDRWHLDLNALMRQRGASELRALLRALRAVARFLRQARWTAGGVPDQTRRKLTHVKQTIEEERSGAQGEVREH